MIIKFDQSKAIIACSTGEDQASAISVIRVSGFADLQNFQKFFSKDLKDIKERYVYLTSLISPSQKQKGSDSKLKATVSKIIDDVLLVFFRGPKSFTGENILEISCHGNPLLVKEIVSLFVHYGECRHAEKGEFSYRAYLNKKMSLNQAEGLNLFLKAKSEATLKMGQDILHGKLNESYLQLHGCYLRFKRSIEICIDFLEDVGEEIANKELLESFFELKKRLMKLKSRVQDPLNSFVSPEIVIVGKTNAGKSSFFNQLLEFGRSIVSQEKGTTRDYITEQISLDGNSFQLIDTAGFRESERGIDRVEIEGIKRGEEILKRAFFKILMINPTDLDFPVELIEGKNFDLVVLSHRDRPNFEKGKKVFLEKFSSKYRQIIEIGVQARSESLVSGPIGPELWQLSSLQKYEGLQTLFKKGVGSIYGVGPIEPLFLKDLFDFIYSVLGEIFFSEGEREAKNKRAEFTLAKVSNRGFFDKLSLLEILESLLFAQSGEKVPLNFRSLLLRDKREDFGPIGPKESNCLEDLQGKKILKLLLDILKTLVQDYMAKNEKSGPIEPLHLLEKIQTQFIEMIKNARERSSKEAKGIKVSEQSSQVCGLQDEDAKDLLEVLSGTLKDKKIRPYVRELVRKKFKRLQEKNPIVIERHRLLILELNDLILEVEKIVKFESDIAIISSEANRLGNLIEELIGIFSSNEVLDSIFSSFCIGK